MGIDGRFDFVCNFTDFNSFMDRNCIVCSDYFICFVTLPVEYDASNRALAWLKERNMVMPNEYDGAKTRLKWAARTYLVAAIGSLAQLLIS